ncbi:MAG: class I SAM-dependent methyltransferase [Rhodospirillales bacterium]
MAVDWDLKALRARTRDAKRRTLHEAGSPNREEIDLYGRFLLEAFPGRKPPLDKRVVVLGMTPALRLLAHRLGCEVVCVDNNAASIEYFRDWNPPESSETERIVQADWLDLARVLGGRADAILGDGVFGNVLSVEDHQALLRVLKDSVPEDGVLIFRKILIPRSFSVQENEAERLLEKFRTGGLTEAEFGFAMRIWGSFHHAYDPKTFLLDNGLVFERYETWLDEGVLSRDEHRVIERYYFAGLNLVPAQDLWESLLAEAGFRFRCEPLKGKSWYRYYPVYCCRVGQTKQASGGAEGPSRGHTP